jgi:transcriptional regulator with XRE-family HTH domain
MSQKGKIIRCLKQCLKARGMTYAGLAKKIDVSEVSLKRYFSEERMTLDTLDLICSALHVELEELLLYSKDLDDARSPSLDEDQERYLCESHDHFLIFLKIARGYTFSQLSENLNNEEMIHLLRVIRGLEEVRLVEFPSESDLRAVLSADAVVKPEGKLWAKYSKLGVEEFFKSNFQNENEYFRVSVGYLPNEKYEEMKRKFEELQEQMVEYANQSRRKKKTSMQTQKFYWCLGAIRPMNIDFIETLAKRLL